MSKNGDLQVRFWGVRGSISISDPNSVRYGGNTSCLEVQCGDRKLIFDAGSGLRYLGNEMMTSGKTFDTDIFLTHTHYDHICGIPFFKPFFLPQNKFRIWAGHLLPDTDLLVLALSLTAETTGIIDSRTLALLPDHAWVVNVARGGHIVTDDLVTALVDGAIGGAALAIAARLESALGGWQKPEL